MAGRAAHGRDGGAMNGVLMYRITNHGTRSSSYRTRRPCCQPDARKNIFMLTGELARRLWIVECCFVASCGTDVPAYIGGLPSRSTELVQPHQHLLLPGTICVATHEALAPHVAGRVILPGGSKTEASKNKSAWVIPGLPSPVIVFRFSR